MTNNPSEQAQKELTALYTKLKLYCLMQFVAADGTDPDREALLHTQLSLLTNAQQATARTLSGVAQLREKTHSLRQTYRHELTVVDTLLNDYPHLMLLTDSHEMAQILKQWTMSNG